MKSKAVGIAGGSCSGKSTLAKRICADLGPDECVLLPQDDYFFGLGDAPPGKGGPNFDHPDAVNFAQMCNHLAAMKAGTAIDRPLYDFLSHLPKPDTERTEPKPIILVDGILILQHPPMRALFDLKIFVLCDEPTRLARRRKRDVKIRGRTVDSVNKSFAEQVAPMHRQYVEPSRNYADIVFNSQHFPAVFEANYREILSTINNLILR